MSIIHKKIGNNKYAYIAIREGGKVIHKYLGPVSNNNVHKMISRANEVMSVPERFKSLFWDTSLINIQIKRNARYIIERVLESGDLDAIQWMQMVYPVRTIMDTLNVSRNITAKSKNFWMIWFGVDDA